MPLGKSAGRERKRAVAPDLAQRVTLRSRQAGGTDFRLVLPQPSGIDQYADRTRLSNIASEPKRMIPAGRWSSRKATATVRRGRINPVRG